MKADRRECFARWCSKDALPDSNFCARDRRKAERWLDESRWAEAEEDAREEWREDWNALGWNRRPIDWRLDDPDTIADALADDAEWTVRRGAA